MRGRRREQPHVSHERWLVSYADFITLLFAFFVVMFAVSQVDQKKLGHFTESFKEALEWQVFEGKGRGMLPGSIPSATVPQAPTGFPQAVFSNEKAGIRKSLEKKAKAIAALAGLQIVEAHGELVLRLPERMTFDVGKARLHDDGRRALEEIAEEIGPRTVRVRIEGHTDSMPIHTPEFPSNWELSTARAMAVVAFLLDTKKVAPHRLAAAGYGEHHPIATNDTIEGRAQNRRTDIVIVAPLAGPPEPSP